MGPNGKGWKQMPSLKLGGGTAWVKLDDDDLLKENPKEIKISKERYDELLEIEFMYKELDK